MNSRASPAFNDVNTRSQAVFRHLSVSFLAVSLKHRIVFVLICLFELPNEHIGFDDRKVNEAPCPQWVGFSGFGSWNNKIKVCS